MASQDWFDKDFYATLGVSKDVSDSDLKKTYRKLARQYHPDSNAGDTAAESRFKEISEAYSVLSDKETRAEYDQVRAMGSGARFTAHGGSGAGGFDDVFGGMFGRGARTSYSQSEFDDLLGGMFGGADRSSGTGGFRWGGGPTKGRDVAANVTLDFLTAIRGETVSLSQPSGKPLRAKIPAGVSDGQRIKLKGKGEPSPDGGEPGDLVLTVSVKKHPVFERDGDNIRLDVPVTFVEATLGATIEVPTLEGDTVRLRVAPGTPSGRVLRVKGRGVAHGSSTGDLLATVQVAVPTHLSTEARRHLEAFAEASPRENPRDDLMIRARQDA
jgi:molecular chaperone DnaJ